jgi:hypothetical protein
MLLLRYTRRKPALYDVFKSNSKIAEIRKHRTKPPTITALRPLTTIECQNIIVFAEME